jgi:hypothetical protein
MEYLPAFAQKIDKHHQSVDQYSSTKEHMG